MTHLIHPAAHFVKAKDAEWVSKLPGLVKLLKDAVELPSVSVIHCSAQYAVCAFTSSLAGVLYKRAEHTGYHVCTKHPAF